MDDKRKTPKLRFPGFTDDWEQRKFGEILDEFSNKSTTENEYPVLSSTNTGMEFRDGRVSGTSNVGYKIINNNDLVLSPQNLWLGNININDIGIGIVSPSYKTFKLRGIETDFFRPQIRTTYLMNEYYNASIQGASVVRRNLDIEKFNDISIFVPSSLEQEAIGRFFSKLDNLITLHQRKLEQMKEYKKGMLQRMFPKNGETVPEIRFPGFAADWEQRKLSEISDIITGTTPPTKDKDNYGGDRLFVSPADIHGNRFVDETITTLTEKGYALGRELRAGTTLFVSIGSTIGKVAQIKESATTNQQINAVIPNGEMDDNFVFTMLENEADKIKKLAATQAVPIINKTTFGETEIQFPKKEEQAKIGEYFLSFDNLITLHQRKLELMKDYKEGLLQQMFV